MFRPLGNLHDLVVLEYRLPFSGERIDAILLGRAKSGRPLAFIIEFKGWRSATPYCTDFVLVEGERRVHPEYQLRNYIGKITHSHSAAELFDVDGCVIMYNLERLDSRLSFHCKSFFKSEEQIARQFLADTFDGPLDQDTAERFVDGKYVQSKRLFEAIREHFDEILAAGNALLADGGYGLSNEQLSLVDRIIEDLENGKEAVYFIQGAPGSGKTLVALHLLLRGLAADKQTVLTYRNSRLIRSLQSVTSDPAETAHLDVPIKFFSTGRPRNPGLAEPGYRGPNLDLAIFDEAQRMTVENIELALLRGKITVFLYDETQILNADEEGTTANLRERAASQGKKPQMETLSGVYRVLGGRAYHEWVESLLNNPRSIEQPADFGNYDFRVVGGAEELFGQLRGRRDEPSAPRVALVAAWTETRGDRDDSTSLNNLRISSHLPPGLDAYTGFSEDIYWLMRDKEDYVPFWVNGGSNQLKQCASIYGCQGFEADYVGVIWGRDFVVRDGKWELGNYSEDRTGRPSLKNIMKLAKTNPTSRDLAIRLLQNRYRIFLTRGIKGTYVFCEDNETSKFLQRMPPMRVPTLRS